MYVRLNNRSISKNIWWPVHWLNLSNYLLQNCRKTWFFFWAWFFVLEYGLTCPFFEPYSLVSNLGNVWCINSFISNYAILSYWLSIFFVIYCVVNYYLSDSMLYYLRHILDKKKFEIPNIIFFILPSLSLSLW